MSKATAALLEKTGWNIFSPITHSHIIPRWIPDRLNTHTFWLGLDFDWIKQCDEMWVFCQPNWDISYGVKEELKLARAEGMKIRFIDMNYKFIGVAGPPEYYEHPKDTHTGKGALTADNRY